MYGFRKLVFVFVFIGMPGVVHAEPLEQIRQLHKAIYKSDPMKVGYLLCDKHFSHEELVHAHTLATEVYTKYQQSLFNKLSTRTNTYISRICTLASATGLGIAAKCWLQLNKQFAQYSFYNKQFKSAVDYRKSVEKILKDITDQGFFTSPGDKNTLLSSIPLRLTRELEFPYLKASTDALLKYAQMVPTSKRWIHGSMIFGATVGLLAYTLSYYQKQLKTAQKIVEFLQKRLDTYVSTENKTTLTA